MYGTVTVMLSHYYNLLMTLTTKVTTDDSKDDMVKVL
jgi:hypothetical protein